jgi:hypothetical protein
MRILDAADVIYAVRVQPLIEEALEADNIQVASVGTNGIPVSGQTVVGSTFLQSESWTLTSYVAGKLLGATPAALGGPPLVGTIGDALETVSAGTTQLANPGINTVPYTSGMAFPVTFDNDSDNPAYDVTVELTLSSAAFNAITTTKTVRETVPGQSYTENMAFSQTPPLNVPLKLQAEVEPVAGEKASAANRMTFYVTFTGSG